MSALNGLTVCITTFRRPDRLEKCVNSVKRAGVRNIIIADGDQYQQDLGCNNTWLVAAYRAKTKRILLLHDDDTLDPDFGEAYESIIAPAMDKGDAGFVSWNAALKYDDGRVEPCPYWEGGSTLMPSHHLLKVVAQRGRLSLSPIVSVLNRATLIRACKEAQDTLRKNNSLERPGMLLGTEILVYMRHIQKFARWLYLDKILSYYGAHEGSGTVKAQKLGHERVLVAGYDLARDQGLCPPPPPKPRLLLVYSKYETMGADTKRRQVMAKKSWDWHFATGDVIEIPYVSDGLPKIKDLLDYATLFALPEDIIVYANADAGLTTMAYERICTGVFIGNGVTCCTTRNIIPHGWTIYKSVANHKAPGGIDVVAMTPQWWKLHREKMPDMFIGREAWDTCFSALAEEWADGRALDDVSNSDLWFSSKAHTDDVCWHEDHLSEWQNERFNEGNKHNRDLARIFFKERNHIKYLEMLK